MILNKRYMKTKIYFIFFFLISIVFFSCAWQNNASFIPVADFSVYDPQNVINTVNITSTMNSDTDGSIPQWLSAFIENGVKEIEELPDYNDKYVFVGINRGTNFTALTRWAENFSTAQDLALLAADRIEKRMILNSTLYPDNEYGRFFEAMIIAASNNEYRGAVKEDTYWYATNPENGSGENSGSEIYYFFVFITIDRSIMKDIVMNMMTLANTVTTPTASQNAAINRLRQNFFEGF